MSKPDLHPLGSPIGYDLLGRAIYCPERLKKLRAATKSKRKVKRNAGVRK